MKEHDSPSTIRLQVYDRMRAPIEARPFALRFHVVRAVRRKVKDGEKVYQNALEEIKHSSNAQLIHRFGIFMRQLVAGELKGNELDAARAVLGMGFSSEIAKVNR